MCVLRGEFFERMMGTLSQVLNAEILGRGHSQGAGWHEGGMCFTSLISAFRLDVVYKRQRTFKGKLRGCSQRFCSGYIRCMD